MKSSTCDCELRRRDSHIERCRSNDFTPMRTWSITWFLYKLHSSFFFLHHIRLEVRSHSQIDKRSNSQCLLRVRITIWPTKFHFLCDTLYINVIFAKFMIPLSFNCLPWPKQQMRSSPYFDIESLWLNIISWSSKQIPISKVLWTHPLK